MTTTSTIFGWQSSIKHQNNQQNPQFSKLYISLKIPKNELALVSWEWVTYLKDTPLHAKPLVMLQYPLSQQNHLSCWYPLSRQNHLSCCDTHSHCKTTETCRDTHFPCKTTWTCQPSMQTWKNLHICFMTFIAFTGITRYKTFSLPTAWPNMCAHTPGWPDMAYTMREWPDMACPCEGDPTWPVHVSDLT